jgi:HEPN domain-containing protein
MLLDKPSPGSAADWLRRAHSDLGLAGIALPCDVLYNELCFHAQQAVEKSIKAVLVHYGVEFKRVHDID